MKQLRWIKAPIEIADGAAVTFRKDFSLSRPVRQAILYVSAVGVYQVFLNGQKQGHQVLAPGFTSYTSRVQYQTLDITDSISTENKLELTVAPGWAVGHIGWDGGHKVWADHMRAACLLELSYTDGERELLEGDSSFEVWTNEVTFADIYHGETIDKTHIPQRLGNAVLDDGQYPLIPQEGADIIEHERIAPIKLIITPKGERVLDFGQNMTGYVSLRIKGKRGERVVLTHAEVLDKDGNFYNGNYRKARNCLTFILSGEEDFFKPSYSYQGFRYARIDEYPDIPVDANAFRAIVVHSDMVRTGRFACGDAKINQLYHNIIWGQKSNYLDIPTDCPQRDERLGWLGDTQVFCRTAAINYDVRLFFKKWLGDLRAEQDPDGSLRGTCPEKFLSGYRSLISAAWADACTIVPWTLYTLYGDITFLSENFEMMRRWVEYMHSAGPEEFLWLGGTHYGDWLALDAPKGHLGGSTLRDLIASAFFAYSTNLLIRSGEVLGKDMTEYHSLYNSVANAFRSKFMENGMPTSLTQTAIILILHFDLCLPSERPMLIEKLEELIHVYGDRMATGFVGTPYILHVLSENGKSELAYKLFFNECKPSWLYSVNHGATTMWEHWDSIMEDGSFWSDGMNSFNHYAYGAVADWMYGRICGVTVLEPGYRRVRIAPEPCKRLGFAKCGIDTVQGRLESHWYYADGRICFEFTVPKGCEAEIVLPNGHIEIVNGGSYCYSTEQ